MDTEIFLPTMIDPSICTIDLLSIVRLLCRDCGTVARVESFNTGVQGSKLIFFQLQLLCKNTKIMRDLEE